MLTRRRIVLLIVLAVVVAWHFQGWSRMINLMMPRDSRPARVEFAVEEISAEEFDLLAAELVAAGSLMGLDFDHVVHFQDGDVLSYEGPSTCLECHERVTYIDGEGRTRSQKTMENLLTSAHYRFYTKEHPNVWGFDGELADDFAMGKINRPCPKPGSFAMTAWAERVVTAAGDTLSEGCGQCHVGGQHQAPLGEMMPGYATLQTEKDAIDCLICHAAVYDMDRKVVVDAGEDRLRWGQDRSLRAALSTVKPTAQACLRCHQHNFGGDVYVDEADPSFMPSIASPGADRPRVVHPGSKRGTPYSPSWDVHAAAGLSCLDCHHAEGHRIARGTHTTTLMANDLPGREVACTQCHGDAPHGDGVEGADDLNDHFAFVACTTCHIPSLQEDNVTRRDFSETEFEDGPGIHVYRDVEKRSAAGEGIAYVWWNGDCTFLGNPVGDRPDGEGDYRFYTAEHRWPEFADFDYEGWYERVMRPIARGGRPSKLYAMKRFNGRQHIDLGNIGPFGGMFVPYDLPLYYRDGDPDAAARAEMDESMMGMMYGWMFKAYMLDRFISYMDVDGWNTDSYDDVKAGRNVEPRWLPNDAMLEISHGVRREGALTCIDCHGAEGVLDWRALGYEEPLVFD